MPIISSGSELKNILQTIKNIAIVGLSNSPERPSFGVASYLISAGYDIFPVNPKYDQILGYKCYPALQDIPENIDLVNIFRRPEYIIPIAQAAIRHKIPIIWMQLGIINQTAADLASDAGLDVIMDQCIKIEHRRLIA